MSLYIQNNLLDVESILECQKNLRCKDCIHFDVYNVNFLGGNIDIDFMFLSQYDPDHNVYIRGDDNGTLYLNKFDSNIPIWLKTNLDEINISIFNNDINATLHKELNEIVYTCDIHSIQNLPTLSNVLEKEFGYNPMSLSSCNMSDLRHIIRDTWYLDMALNKYTLCNYDESRMVFENVAVENIYLDEFKNQGGGILINGYNLINMSNDILTAKTSTSKHGLCMLNSNVPSCSNFSRTFKEFQASINEKQLYYDSNVNSVANYITSNIDSFFINSNNLNDFDHPDVIVDNLELSKLKHNVFFENDSISLSNLTLKFVSGTHDLQVNSFKTLVETKYPFYINRPYSYVFLNLTSNNIYQVTDALDVVSADTNVCGQVKCLANLRSTYKNEEPHTTVRYEHMYETNFQEVSKLQRSLDYINIDNILEIIYLESVSANTRLMRSTNNLAEMADITLEDRYTSYNNLELSSIIRTLDFDDLTRKPYNISCFYNDVTYLSNKTSLKEVNGAQSLHSLGVKSVSRLDVDNFIINGNTLYSDFLNVTSRLNVDISTETCIDNDSNIVLMGCTTQDGQVSPKEILHRLLSGKKLVRLHDTLQYDNEGTYTIQLLNEVYVEIHEKIKNIRNSIEHIKQIITP